MKDFTYYDDDKISLRVSDCQWLREMGLVETQWILDIKWLLMRVNRPVFKEWIGE